MPYAFPIPPHVAGNSMEKDMPLSELPKCRLRTAEAATYCGSTKSTFEKYRVTGEGSRYSKIGRIVVYDVADLDAWLAERRFRSTSDYPSEAA